MSSNKENILYEEDGEEEEEEEEEEEVFFGPVGEKEKKKLAKFSKRKTILFTPGFRSDRKLMRYSMDQSNLGTVSEELGCKGEELVSNDKNETGQATSNNTIMHRLSLNANETSAFEMSTLEPIGECEEQEDNPVYSGTNGNQLEPEVPNQNNNNASIVDTSADLFDSKENSPCVMIPKSSIITDRNGDTDSPKTVDDLVEMLPKLDISQSEDSAAIMTDDSVNICTGAENGENTEDSNESIQGQVSSNSDESVSSGPKDGSDNIERSGDETTETSPKSAQNEKLSHDISTTNSCQQGSTEPIVQQTIEPGQNQDTHQDMPSPSSVEQKDDLFATKSPVLPCNKNSKSISSSNYPNIIPANSIADDNSTSITGNDLKSIDNGMATDDIFKKPSVTPVSLKSATKTPSSVHSEPKNKQPVIQAPNSGKRAFKRSSTSAFQTTPKSGSKTTPSGSSYTPLGSSPHTGEPGSYVFKETNFSPTLKVSDMKRPISLTMIPQMPVFGSQASLASFDGHERQIELDELSRENLVIPRVVRESGRAREREAALSLSEDEAIDVNGACGAESLPVYKTGTPRWVNYTVWYMDFMIATFVVLGTCVVAMKKVYQGQEILIDLILLVKHDAFFIRC